MKPIIATTVALLLLGTASAVVAQERQVTVYSGLVGVELPASMLRSSDPKAATAGNTPQARKVRVVLQSPYGN